MLGDKPPSVERKDNADGKAVLDNVIYAARFIHGTTSDTKLPVALHP